MQSRLQILEAYQYYLEHEIAKGTPARVIARHVMGLFTGLPNARSWRRQLGEMLMQQSSPDLLGLMLASVCV